MYLIIIFVTICDFNTHKYKLQRNKIKLTNKTLETIKIMKKSSTSSNMEKDFLEFLKSYQSENFAELLHDALFILSVDQGSPEEFKRPIADALYAVRHGLNLLQTKYLPPEKWVENCKGKA